MSVDTVLVAVGDLAAAVAAGAAVWSVRLAKRAVRAARETIELTEAARRDAEAARRDAEAARRDAETARRDAERDRHRHRLVRVGQTVEDVFWAAEQDLKYNPATDGWKDPRNRLRHALVGLTEELPRCFEVVKAGGAGMAKGAASRARDEVEQALRRLEEDASVT